MLFRYSLYFFTTSAAQSHQVQVEMPVPESFKEKASFALDDTEAKALEKCLKMIQKKNSFMMGFVNEKTKKPVAEMVVEVETVENATIHCIFIKARDKKAYVERRSKKKHRVVTVRRMGYCDSEDDFEEIFNTIDLCLIDRSILG